MLDNLATMRKTLNTARDNSIGKIDIEKLENNNDENKDISENDDDDNITFEEDEEKSYKKCKIS